ncbi:hypothetical protein N9L68_04170 [bacterium]|nr:hypothetical protein [bacterium]
MLEGALRTFPRTTAAASYGISPPCGLEQDPESLACLAGIVDDIDESLVLPAQDFLNLIVWAGKPGGGERGLGLLGFAYRTLMRVRRPRISEWDAAKAGWWDRAIKGSGALQAAMKRALRVELACLEGDDATEILWDLSHFYDSARIATIGRKAIVLEYPRGLMALAVLVHTGPRVLRVALHNSDQIDDTHSLLAGCGQAIDLARIAVYSCFEVLSEQSPQYTPEAYIDDFPQVGTGPEDELVTGLSEAAVLFHSEVKDAGFEASVKTTVVPATSRAARRIHRRLLQAGIHTKLAKGGRDLGLDAGGGRERVRTFARGRLAKGQRRAQRTAILSRQNSRAAKLYPTGGRQSERWGNAGLGLSWKELLRIRSQQVQALGAGAAGRSTYVTLCLHWGDKDPVAVILAAGLEDWLDLYESLTETEQNRCRGHWPRQLPKMAPVRTRWRRVKGPMLTAMAALYDIGWTPATQTAWVTDTGAKLLLKGGRGRHALRAAVAETLARRSWAKAAQHYEGLGLQDGADLSVGRRLMSAWRKSGAALECKLAEVVMTAGQWPMTRVQAFRPDVVPLCPRCMESEETLWHRYWECPCNDALEEEAITASYHLVEQATLEAATWPTFWLRALPSTSWSAPLRPAGLPRVSALQAPSQILRWAVGSDASGGPQGADPGMRRVGIGGVLAFDTPTGFQIGQVAVGQAVGAQTVPRGELEGAVLGLKLLEGWVGRDPTAHGNAEEQPCPAPMVLDASYVVSGWGKDPTEIITRRHGRTFALQSNAFASKASSLLR